MANSPLMLSRRHVLGDLYSKFDRFTSVPIFWHDALETPLGTVEESEGGYADAFTFHIAEEFCKKLAAGQLICKFNYEFADGNAGKKSKVGRRLKLTSFVLESRQNYEKPVPSLIEKTAETP